MPEYPIEHTQAINPDKLTAELKAYNAAIGGFTGSIEPNSTIWVISDIELTAPQLQAVATIVTIHNPALTPAQQLEVDRAAARLILIDMKQYIRTQLEAVSPASAQDQVTFLKPAVTGNAFLTLRMTKLINLANAAYGWGASLNLNPATTINYQRYLEIYIQMVGIET